MKPEVKMRQMENRLWWMGIQAGIIIMASILMAGFTSEKDRDYTIYSAGTPQSDPWPSPDTLHGGIPIFRSFDQLSPLFNFENDTTYVINFWATWCKPCIEELPILEALNTKSKKEKIKVVLVSLDFAEQVEGKLIPFVQNQGLNSSVLLLLDHNFNKWINEISPEWSGAIPATYIYKRNQSQIILTKFDTLEELEEKIKPFL